MRQLDGLRTLAITLVTVEHWLHTSLLNQALPTGFMGVRLFFVLSGYLITGILLRGSGGQEERGACLISFYARRFLRIFPVYYLTLAVLYAIDISTVRSLIAWHVTYTSDIFYFLHQGLVGRESHFWSLAVEEQFYLLWPLVLTVTPRRHLRKTMVAFVAVGVLSRTLLLSLGYTYVLTFPLTCFDSLALGGLLAETATSGREHVQRSLTLGRPLWWLNALALVLLFLFPIPFDRTHWFYQTFLSLSWSIFFVWLVGRASVGLGGPAGAFLENRIVTYIGKISYGFYIFHVFVGAAYEHVASGSGVRLLGNEYVAYVLMYGLTVGLAATSWHLFEAPINSLKRHWRY